MLPKGSIQSPLRLRRVPKACQNPVAAGSPVDPGDDTEGNERNGIGALPVSGLMIEAAAAGCRFAQPGCDRVCRRYAASLSIEASTASPISAVLTTFAPSVLMSLVRNPLPSVAAIACSIRSASLPMAKE
jgi:hypothetical protein